MCTLFSYCTGEIFWRKDYVFKCNAAAACQWYGSVCGDFCGDTDFFASAGTADLLWQNGKESGDSRDCICLHISYERNTVNAAVNGCIFRTVFYFWNPYFNGVQSDRGIYCLQY